MPPLPPDTTETVINAVRNASNAIDLFEADRQAAASQPGGGGVPFDVVDRWIRAIRGELTQARHATRHWQRQARDIRENAHRRGTSH